MNHTVRESDYIPEGWSGHIIHLITAPGESTGISLKNSLWQQTPFNGHFASSLFFSQDPVAIDSVGADFLANEPVMIKNNSILRRNRGIENYLHEAALVANPPSGTLYDDGYGHGGIILGSTNIGIMRKKNFTDGIWASRKALSLSAHKAK